MHKEEQGTPICHPKLFSVRTLMRRIESVVEIEEFEFKVDVRIGGIAQDVIRENEERMGHYRRVVEITNWVPINYLRFGEVRKIHQVQRRVEPHNSRIWQY